VHQAVSGDGQPCLSQGVFHEGLLPKQLGGARRGAFDAKVLSGLCKLHHHGLEDAHDTMRRTVPAHQHLDAGDHVAQVRGIRHADGIVVQRGAVVGHGVHHAQQTHIVELGGGAHEAHGHFGRERSDKDHVARHR
jgi:hypothetical protein